MASKSAATGRAAIAAHLRRGSTQFVISCWPLLRRRNQMFLTPDPFERRRTARRRRLRGRDRFGRQVDLTDAAHHRSVTANSISGRTTLLMRPLLAITSSGTAPAQANLARPQLRQTGRQTAELHTDTSQAAHMRGQAAVCESGSDYFILTIHPPFSKCRSNGVRWVACRRATGRPLPGGCVPKAGTGGHAAPLRYPPRTNARASASNARVGASRGPSPASPGGTMVTFHDRNVVRDARATG
jgi:hypothetical protein